MSPIFIFMLSFQKLLPKVVAKKFEQTAEHLSQSLKAKLKLLLLKQ